MHLNRQFAALAGRMHQFLQLRGSLCSAAAQPLEVLPVMWRQLVGISSLSLSTAA